MSLSRPSPAGRPSWPHTMTDLATPRFIFYSHDGFGLGHFRRNVVLALAIADLYPEASVLLACGADGLETFSLPNRVDLLRLPGLHKIDDGRYVGHRLRVDASELVSLRAALLASAVEHFRPHVLLVDKHPVGVHEELLPALRLLSRDGGRAALGLRDVLDDTDRTADEWRKDGLSRLVAEFHDLVLIYGTRELLNPLTPELLPSDIDGRVRFCGYVVGGLPASELVPADLPRTDGKPLVLASAGGGEDGLPVLEAFIEASRGAAWQGAVVAGPLLEGPRWVQLEARAAEAGVLAYRSVHQMQRWFPHADALVCMGGYNTLLEAVSSGTPAVCVPRVRPRREQLIRARAFAAKGLLELVEPDALSGPVLAAAIETALGTPRSLMAEKVRQTLDLDGARRAASLLLDLAGRPGSVAVPSVELSAH
jgi:predicted glycosyltransferase